MAFNIFDKIISGAKYVTSGQIGSDIYDATHNEDPTQTLQYKAASGISDVASASGKGLKKGLDFTLKANPLTALPYKATQFLMEDKNAQGALSDVEKMYTQKAQDISQWGSSVANKPGYIKLGQMVKSKHPQYQDMSDEELGKKIFEKYPQYKDIVDSKRTTIGQSAKILSGIGSMAVSAPGMVAGGLSDYGQGMEKISQAKSGQEFAEGGLQTGKGLLKTGFGIATGATPIASTVFGGISGTDTGQETLGYVGKKAGDIGEGTSRFLGGNEQVQEQARGFGEMAVPALALGGLSKGGKYVAPVLKKGVENISPALRQTGQVMVPKIVETIKKPSDLVKNKAIDIFGKEQRPVQDIAGNILQPYKGMVENLDDATNGLRRVIDETGTQTDTFEGLLGKINETLSKYGKMKQDSLSQITQTKKSVSAQKALENLDDVYSNVSSKDMLNTQSRIKELARKNMDEGLTPIEIDEVKVLHTKSNNLFNEKGQTTGGFSSDDLRGLRKDLKNEIEDFATENGVTNIREINKAYGEIADAKTLAQNQVDNLTAYKGRSIPSTRVQKIADFIMEFPVIKQAFSDPARILASSLFKTLRGDKINPIEVQKRLPDFLNELNDAGMKYGDLKKIEMMINNEINGIKKNGNSNNNRSTTPSNSTKLKPSSKPLSQNL